MEFPNSSKICLALVAFILLCPSMSWGDWSILLFDDFDDGNYDGWSATHPETGEPVTPPDVVSSPEGYSLRGVGSGYSPDPGQNVWLTYPLLISNAGELKIEMRAKSGPEWPNSAWVNLISGADRYVFGDYGESNQWAQFYSYIDGEDYWYNYSINANVWHDFAWIRDADGWWSLSIDGQVEAPNFHQDNQLTSFEPIGIQVHRDQSEIEWVRISSVSEPAEGWIAFMSQQDGDPDIWAVRPDGTGLRQLTNMPGAEGSPQWSSDSTKIVYGVNPDVQIWVYDWFTGTNTKIYDGDDYGGQHYLLRAALSPDGSKILFTEQKTYNNPHITVINADGTERKEVPVEPGYVGNTAWSPSGTAFVYERRNSWSATSDLWIYDFTATGDIMDGTNIRLTTGATGVPTTKVNPDWTPSGQIVFCWGRNLALIEPGQSPNWNGPISDPLDPKVTFLYEGQYAGPSWSPDVSQIVTDLYAPSAPSSDMWIVDASPNGNRDPLAGIVGNQPDWGNPVCEPERIEATIDIKPRSCPNPLNVRSKGVLPLAILGSEDFDVTTIDVASIRLVDAAPIRSSFEDVATPVSDGNECDCTTEGPDGYIDLTLKFETREIVEALGEVNDGDELVLNLTGVLYSGVPIEGADCIVVRGKFKPFNSADLNKDGVVDAVDFAMLAENWLKSSVVVED